MNHPAELPPKAVAAAPAEPPASTPVEHQLDPSLRLPLHVNARGLALGIIATVSFVYALQWAQKFLIPVIFGIFIAYTLNPLVAWLEKIRLPRAIGATVVTALILFGSIVVIERVQG